MKRAALNRRCILRTFPLPHEVFQLDIKKDVLLVYLSLVRCLSSAKYPGRITYASISHAVNLSERTVRKHMRLLEEKGYIQIEEQNGSLICSLCPIRGKVRNPEKKKRAPLRPRSAPAAIARQYITEQQHEDREPLPL